MNTLVIVGCCDKKRAAKCAARDLYMSPLFRWARTYAEKYGTAGWLIASAEHGLLRPDDVIAPYDRRLPTAHDERWAWRHLAQAGFACWLGDHPEYCAGPVLTGLRIEVIAGRDYAELLGRTAMKNYMTEPLAGLPIGQRLSWLRRAVKEGLPAARALECPLFPDLDNTTPV